MIHRGVGRRIMGIGHHQEELPECRRKVEADLAMLPEGVVSCSSWSGLWIQVVV